MIVRRKALQIGLVAVSLPIMLGAEVLAGSQAESTVSFRLRVPEAHRNILRDALPADVEQISDSDVKGIVYIFVGAVLLAYLAKVIMSLRRDMVYGGIIIDLRREPVEITTDKALSGGVILVIGADGNYTLYDRAEIENPSALVEVLLNAK